MPRAPWVYLAAVALGAGSLLLGRAGGGWFWVANMSAPWLVLAFAGGALSRSWWTAVLAGGTVTAIALAAFYVAAWEPVQQVMSAEWRYLVGGAITGPAFAFLGFAWRSARRRLAIFGAVAIGGAFVLEPLAWTIWERYLPAPDVIWIIEACVGVVLALALILNLGRRRAG
jgi:hypothetical protein